MATPHTGDYSIFRVYVSKDNKAASYSTEKRSFKSLSISYLYLLKELKTGDYSMIYGFPGGTNRYESSYGN